MKPTSDPKFLDWLSALERRHLAELTFPEVRRALQALSHRYVARRATLGSGAALSGAGKRAAFSVFYGPLHYLILSHVVARLEAGSPAPERILDVGCGSGAAGAAWALGCEPAAAIDASDIHPWAVTEARWTLGQLDLRRNVTRQDAVKVQLPGSGGAVLAAFVVNELDDTARDRLLQRMLDAARRGARLLVVEPIARRPVPWWDSWREAFDEFAVREDLWRIDSELPDLLQRLDKAAGLDHRRLTARSLYVRGRGPALPARKPRRPESPRR